MPDHLHRAAPAYDTIQANGEAEDEDLKAERSWLMSCLRCYFDNGLLEAPKDQKCVTTPLGQFELLLSKLRVSCKAPGGLCFVAQGE